MNSKSKKDNKKVWVEIEVNKYTDGGITVFRGQIHKDDLQAWASGELTEGSLKVDNTHWYLGDTICYLGKGSVSTKQYTGVTYLRLDTIMTIFVLKDDALPGLKSSSNRANIFPFPGRE